MSTSHEDATAVSLTATAAVDEVDALLREADAILNRNSERIDSSVLMDSEVIIDHNKRPTIDATIADEVLSAPTTTISSTAQKSITLPKSIMKPSIMPPQHASYRLPSQHTTKKFSKDQLMKLEANQTTYSNYPIDCRVHYNFNQVSTTTATTTPSQSRPKLVCSYCVGRIKSVYLDPSSRNFVYEVAPIPSKKSGNSTEMLTESSLAYAPGTPVCVQFSEKEAVQDGEIIGCKVVVDPYHPNAVDNNVKMYSVQLSMYKNIAQMYENAHESMILHRKKKRKVAYTTPDVNNTSNCTIGVSTSQKIDVKKKAKKKKAISKASLSIQQLSATSGAAARRRRKSSTVATKLMNANSSKGAAAEVVATPGGVVKRNEMG